MIDLLRVYFRLILKDGLSIIKYNYKKILPQKNSNSEQYRLSKRSSIITAINLILKRLHIILRQCTGTFIWDYVYSKNRDIMNRNTCTLSLVGINPYVEGATRLQKYGFLCAKKIKSLEKIGFYNDWIASNYGPYSPQLASDLEDLIAENMIKKYPIRNEYGYLVDRFIITDAGKSRLEQFIAQNPSEYKDMQKLVMKYNDKSLSEVLQDVYYQFPEYATKSKIRAEVNKKIYETDSYHNPLFDHVEE